MKGISIREAEACDCPSILELIRELAAFEKLEYEVIATIETLQNSLFNAERPHAFVLLAEIDGEIAGFCVYFYNFSTFIGRPGIYIEDIFVRPAFRAQGLGKRFFAKIGEIAIAQQCGRIEWCVLNWNQRAIDLYKRLGAEAMSEWVVYRLTADTFVSLASNS